MPSDNVESLIRAYERAFSAGCLGRHVLVAGEKRCTGDEEHCGMEFPMIYALSNHISKPYAITNEESSNNGERTILE